MKKDKALDSILGPLLNLSDIFIITHSLFNISHSFVNKGIYR